MESLMIIENGRTWAFTLFIRTLPLSHWEKSGAFQVFVNVLNIHILTHGFVQEKGNCKSTYTGWWFGTWLLFFHYIGNVIIPTDEVIFSRGVGSTTNHIVHTLW